MECTKCNTLFSSKEKYNNHVLNQTCSAIENNSHNEYEDNHIVYTNAGDPIRAQDDISEFLNEDDDDFVGGG
ncbi:MAG: hypothetical protein H8E60_01795 [Candidatus Marinimicrobia bacterium]|nr:hypothetical protein [Candidatus Neomarinimicrobiota bacterium]